jgi:DNA modification methylase
MQSLKLLSSSSSWSDLNKKLEELTKSGQAKFAGDNMKEADKQLRTVWDIPNNKGKDELKFGNHPTQKPLRVSERLMMISGIKDGKLLVPFAGSGTENCWTNKPGFSWRNSFIYCGGDSPSRFGSVC